MTDAVNDKSRQTISPSRCDVCRKKVALLGFECIHCCKMHCSVHRFPNEGHSCTVDLKREGLKKLEASLQKVVPSKVAHF